MLKMFIVSVDYFCNLSTITKNIYVGKLLEWNTKMLSFWEVSDEY